MIFDKNKFRELREARGLTLSQVANACNVSQSMVSRWEKEGESYPLPAKIQKLAAILQCETSDLAEFGKSKRIKFNRENFLRIRMDRGLSQQEIANACGVSECSVSNWENGINIPRPAKIEKLAEILKCTKEDLATIDPAETLPSLAKIIAGLERSLSELKRYAAIKEHENDF